MKFEEGQAKAELMYQHIVRSAQNKISAAVFLLSTVGQ